MTGKFISLKGDGAVFDRHKMSNFVPNEEVISTY